MRAIPLLLGAALATVTLAAGARSELGDQDRAFFEEVLRACTENRQKLERVPDAVRSLCISQASAESARKKSLQKAVDLQGLRFQQQVQRLSGSDQLARCLGQTEAPACLAMAHWKNEQALAEFELTRILASAAVPGTAIASMAERQVQEARLATFLSATKRAAYAPQYGFYLGSSFSLEADGDWQPGVETMARFLTEACPAGRSTRFCGGERWWRGYTEVSYQTLGVLDEAEDTADSTVDGLLTDPQPAVPITENPFTTPGGFFRVNLGVQYHFGAWGGAQAVVGASSLPNGEDRTLLEPRHSYGFNFQTFFADGAVGELFLGYAHDEFWQREVFRDPADPAAGTRRERAFDRIVLEGSFLPSVRLDSFHFVVRLFADVPANGEGPSDVRLSALLYYDISGWLRAFRTLGAPLGTGLPLQAPL